MPAQARPVSAPLVTILDDEAEIRALLRDALEEAGFRTECFARASAFEAAMPPSASTTPAPFRMTGNFASDKRAAALAIELSPPGLASNSIGSGISISTTCVQKSRGMLIWVGPESRFALAITRVSTSATRVGSRTSS